MKRGWIVWLLALSFLLAAVAPAQADGVIIPRPMPPRPLPPEPIANLAIKYHHVTVTIEDQIATTHVDQVFVNELPYEIEGEYIFPLPEDASISQFAMWVDGVRLEAEVLDRDEAAAIYEEIVRSRRDPALLEYVGRNAFRARIYPIEARGEKRVEIEYTEVLPMDSGLVRYHYPLSTEKFSSQPLEQVSVTVQLRSERGLKAVYSPSHDVQLDRDGDHAATVSYEASGVVPNKDFALYYAVSEEDLGASLLSYKEGGEDGFFLLLLAPRAEVEVSEVLDKDVLFVLDISGSMRGDKLAQAKRAAKYVLDNLYPNDRFSIVAFATSTRHYAQGLRPASESAEARAFVDQLQARGGTNIDRALEEALAQADPERPQIVIFLTDGLPTEGELRTDVLLSNVAERAGENVRLFAFGVGYDVNTVLLDTMAQAQRGTSAYVRPEEDIEVAVSSLYEKISTPVLADVEVDLGDVLLEDAYPHPLPDLFAGGQLVMAGRYREGGATTITLQGTVDGEPVQYTFGEQVLAERGGDDFIPRLWATRKIGHLLTQIRLHGADKELVDEIVELSVRYGVVTPYTSFLVDETEDALTEGGRRELARRDFAAQGPARPGAQTGGMGGGASADAGVSGEAAVTKSQEQELLRNADVASESPAEQVRTLGNKTFVLRDEVWVDTTYDPQRMQTQRVAFGSERYFEMARVNSDWGRYLALGSRVIVVLDGQAFEVGPDGATEALGLPTPTPASPTPTQTPASDATPTPPPPSEPSGGLWGWLRDWLGRLGG